MKTSELTGPALDWAVATAEGKLITCDPMGFGVRSVNGGYWIWDENMQIGRHYIPSNNWSQGGPIIERHDISLAKVGRSLDDAMAPHPDCWCAHIDGDYSAYDSTPLVAAMRCLVKAKLGYEVEAPDELL